MTLGITIKTEFEAKPKLNAQAGAMQYSGHSRCMIFLPLLKQRTVNKINSILVIYCVRVAH